MYLTRCLDGDSLHCSNSLNRCGGALPVRNQIRGEQCPCPAKASLAMNGNRSVCRTLRPDKPNELV